MLQRSSRAGVLSIVRCARSAFTKQSGGCAYRRARSARAKQSSRRVMQGYRKMHVVERRVRSPGANIPSMQDLLERGQIGLMAKAAAHLAQGFWDELRPVIKCLLITFELLLLICWKLRSCAEWQKSAGAARDLSGPIITTHMSRTNAPVVRDIREDDSAVPWPFSSSALH